MTDYTISSKLSNETVYACYRGRFWRWDGSFWKESHLMTQKFERARAADKNLTPQAFLTNGAEFAPLDEYEIDCAMLDALENAKPCKNAPIEPVKEESECQTSTPAASPAKNSSVPAANADSSSVAPAVQSMTATEAVTFDFGADDQTNALLLQDAQTFITGNMARIMAAKHAHDLTANHYQGLMAQLKAEKDRADKAEARAKNAEDALKKQPIVGVTDPEEVRRQADALAAEAKTQARRQVEDAQRRAREAEARYQKLQQDADGFLAPEQSCAQQAKIIADSMRSMYLGWFGLASTTGTPLARMAVPIYQVCDEIRESLEEDTTINPTAEGSVEDAEREALFE